MENGLTLANVDAEQSVLGAIFLEPEMYQECYLKANYFYETRNQIIYNAIEQLAEKGIPISLIAVAEQLGGLVESIGGLSYLSQLGQSMPTTASFMHYQKIITQHYERRQQISLLERMMKETLEGDPSEVRDSLRTSLEQLDDLNNVEGDDDHISGVLSETFTDMQIDKGDITGAATGFRDLDKMTSGLQRKELVIIGGRPSMGKSAFAINIAENYALATLKGHGGPVCVISLEMPNKGLAKRMISSGGNIDSEAMRNPQRSFDKADWNKVAMVMGELGKTPFHLSDKSSMTTAAIRRKCKRMTKLYPGQHIVVIIDYLQMIAGNPKHQGNRTQEVSEISRDLKNIARDLDLTIVALSQLSRGVEQRQDKRPMMSDLKEAGGIEQDADVVILLYRDDYYDKESESKNMVDVIIAKQRNGPTGTVTLAFKKEFSKFLNIDWTQHQAS